MGEQTKIIHIQDRVVINVSFLLTENEYKILEIIRGIQDISLSDYIKDTLVRGLQADVDDSIGISQPARDKFFSQLKLGQ